MAILGIYNRTENWKTAYEFAPFFRDGNACAKLPAHWKNARARRK